MMTLAEAAGFILTPFACGLAVALLVEFSKGGRPS